MRHKLSLQPAAVDPPTGPRHTRGPVRDLKDTSVASLIAAPDLMLRAQDLSSVYFMPLEIYILVGAIYFALCYPLSLGVRLLERRTRH